jgi:hypothetical protein
MVVELYTSLIDTVWKFLPPGTVGIKGSRYVPGMCNRGMEYPSGVRSI